MIASHNTFTYLPPKHWWQRLWNFAARCQTKTFDEQYAVGVRFFDIRIKNLRCLGYDKHNNNIWRYDYGHTATTYELPSRYYTVTNLLTLYRNVGLRIINEDGKHKALFKAFCEDLIDKYPTNIRECIEGRDTWKVIALGDYRLSAYVDFYPQKTNHWWQLGIRWPWIENKSYPQPTQEEIEDPYNIYWFDFI